MARTKQSNRRLTGYVHLPATEDRAEAVYGPDDEVPAEDAERITNPAAWETEDDQDDDEDGNAHIRASSIPRRELVARAKELGIAFGSGGLPKNSSDAVIAAAIRQKEGRQTGAQPAGTIDPADLDLGDGEAAKVEEPDQSGDSNDAGA